MSTLVNTNIRLSAQRALLGAIPSSLRAVSIEVSNQVISIRNIFDNSCTESDKELMSASVAEIASDFPDAHKIEEELLVIPEHQPMQHLEHLVFLRYEP
jgi:hypothetical protein